ncbi:MAG: hypothetical protein ACPGVK_07595, partial [Halocynthiibacter sp.]
TGVHGFAIRCVTTPPTRLYGFCVVVVEPHILRRFLCLFCALRKRKIGNGSAFSSSSAQKKEGGLSQGA